MRGAVLALLLSVMTINGALSKDIAICGESEGYSYYPMTAETTFHKPLLVNYSGSSNSR